MRNNPLQSKTWRKWIIIFICWTSFGLFFTTQGYINQARYVGKIEWGKLPVLYLIWTCVWYLLTPLILKLSTRFPLQRGKLLRHIVIHSFAAPFFFIINTTIYVIIEGLLLGSLTESRIESFRNIFLVTKLK